VEYRVLGRTGVKVSSLCLGAMMFGDRTSHEDSIAIIDKALGLGINFVDTANVYAGGASEEAVGEALQRHGGRDRVVLATKVFGVIDPDDVNGFGNSRRHIIQQVENSLRRLKTDWIDLYQVHRPQASVPIDETLRALDDLIRDGKVRYIGTSTFAAWQLMESLSVSEKLRLNRFVSEQPPYNLMDRRIERELIPFAQSYGFAVLPWSPLAGGQLTGKYRRGEGRTPGSRFANPSPQQAPRYTENLFDVVEGLEPIAAEKGCTLSQLALAWVLQQPGVTSPIIGPRTMEQFDDNTGALDVQLTAADLKAIDAVAPPGKHVAPYYEGYDWGPEPYR
jgi:aryl-alcohol dehydrogenase-like predicted oxidoreductase